MADSIASHARVYWITWSVLLALTVLMLAADGAAISRATLVALMLGAMGVKAALIAGNFMHLRQERAGLVLTVVVGLFVMGIVLYVLMAPDAVRIHEMTTGAGLGTRDPGPGRMTKGAGTIAAVVLAALILAFEPVAAQCAMCRRALDSPEGQHLVGALRRGIVVLLAAPFVLFGAVAFLAVRAQKRRSPR